MNDAFEITVQTGLALQSLFIGDRSPMEILHFQLVICFFGDWVAVVPSVRQTFIVSDIHLTFRSSFLIKKVNGYQMKKQLIKWGK